MHLMSWIGRSSIAIVLAVTCGAIPVSLARCAAWCEAAPATVTPASDPNCHHATSTTARIGSMPAPCNHDHGASVTTRASEPAPKTRALVAAVGLSVGHVVATDAAALWIDFRSIGSPPTPRSHTLALPLRI